MRVLITGGLGLIGTGLAKFLQGGGGSVEILDTCGKRRDGTLGDIRDLDCLRTRAARCDGIVHLAAVSRVIWGERDPDRCWDVNVDGTRNVLTAAAEQPSGRRPWVIYASSREVYGQADQLPVHEDAPLRPINVYGRTKAAAERLVTEARGAGLATAVVRFSNVYGTTKDHSNRVVPAFACAAASGGTMRVEGADHIFDFTWLADVCDGLVTLCQAMSEEAEGPPPVHFVSGCGTSLLELAELAREAGGVVSPIVLGAPRDFDVDRFCGDPRRAKELFGWRAQTTVKQGVARLVAAFQAELAEEAAGQRSARSGR